MTARNQTKNSRLLQALKAEIRFFDARGYGRTFRSKWRPTLLLRDSPACANYNHSARRNPCSQCPLFSLVPLDQRNRLVPCHFIPLDKQGRTIAELYQHGSQESLDREYRTWLEDFINALKTSS